MLTTNEFQLQNTQIDNIDFSDICLEPLFFQIKNNTVPNVFLELLLKLYIYMYSRNRLVAYALLRERSITAGQPHHLFLDKIYMKSFMLIREFK